MDVEQETMSKDKESSNMKKLITVLTAICGLSVCATEKQFGVGQLSEFRIAASEVGYVAGVSGLAWSDFAKQTYKGEQNGTSVLSFYGYTNNRIVDAEKNSKTDSDDYWCPALTDVNLLVWGGWAADAGYTDEDALADFFRATPNLIVEAKNDTPQWNNTVYGQEGVIDWFKAQTGTDLWASNVEGVDVYDATFADSLVTMFASADRLIKIYVLFSNYTWKGSKGVGHSVTCCGYSIDPTASTTNPSRIKALFIIDSDNDMFNVAGGPSAPDMITYCPLKWTGSEYQLSNVFGTTGNLYGDAYALRAKTSPTVNKTSDLNSGTTDGGKDSGTEDGNKDSGATDGGKDSGTEDGNKDSGTTDGKDSGEEVNGEIVGAASISKATTLYGIVQSAGEVIGSVEIKLGKASSSKGSKVSGSVTLFGAKKKTLKASSNAFLANGPDDVDLAVGKTETASIRIGTKTDGTLAFSGTYGAYTIESANVGGEWTKTAYFRLPDGFATTVNEATVNTVYLPDGEVVTMNGKRWTVAKAASIKYTKDRSSGNYKWVVNNGKDDSKKTNLSGLKLTYTAKTGVFKGSFYVYSLQNNKMKKKTVSVVGLVVDGVGYGLATLKGTGSYAVEISDPVWTDFGYDGTTVSNATELRTAIANASSGDTIYLKNGNYAIESSLAVQKSLNLIGQTTDGVIITGDEDNGLNGLYFGFLSNSSINVRVLKCTFARIDVWYGANVYLEECKQTSTADYNGLLCYAPDGNRSASVRAVNCDFRSAVCSMGENASIVIEGCTIDQTNTDAWGLYATKGSLTASTSTITGGAAGVFAFNGSVVTVSNCTISNADYAVNAFSGSSVTLTNCRIEGCGQEQRTYEGGKISIK